MFKLSEYKINFNLAARHVKQPWQTNSKIYLEMTINTELVFDPAIYLVMV